MKKDDASIVENNTEKSFSRKFLLALLLPILALPFYRLTNHHVYIPSSVVAHVVSFLLLFFLVCKNRESAGNYIIENRCLILALSVWMIYMVINSLAGFYPVHSLYRVFSRFFMAMPAALLLGFFLKEEKNRRRLLSILVTVLALYSLMLVLEGLFFSRFYGALRTAGLEIIHRFPNQAMGLQVNPNDTGFLIVSLFFLSSLMIFALNKKYLYLFLFTIPASNVALVFVNSRSSYIGFLLILIFDIVFLAGILYRGNKISHRKTMGFLITGAGLILLFFIFADVLLPERFMKTYTQFKMGLVKIFESGFSGEQIYNQMLLIDPYRLHIWREVMNTMSSHPFMGVGYGIYSKVNPLGHGCWNAHNYLFGILVEQGLIGFSLYITQSLVIFRGIKENYIRYSVIIFPLLMLFDDLSWSYSMPIVFFFLYGIYFSRFSWKIRIGGSNKKEMPIEV